MFFKRNPIKVSVILPVYNDELYIEQCMENIINQTLEDVEIICVDDGSTDDTYQLLKKIARRDKRIQLIHEENRGAGAARNVGMSKARGEYLYFPDSDDIPCIDLLKKSYEKAIETDSDVVVFKSNRLDEKCNTLEPCNFSLYSEKLPQTNFFSISDVEGNFFRFFMGWAWDKLFRHSFVESHNLKFQEQRTTNDMYFVYMSLVYANRISIVEEELYTQRINIPTSLSMTRNLSWECFYYALFLIRDELKRCEKWNDYQSYFLDYAMHACVANYLMIEGESDAIKKKIKEYIAPNLGLSNATQAVFTNSYEYKIFLSLLD